MEVVKIRLQAQQHSLADPLEAPKYRNAGHAVYAIVREEGFSALYRGVTLTALRQATNQGAYLFRDPVLAVARRASTHACRLCAGANFTAYQELKKFAQEKQPELTDLPSWQHMLIGLISGAMGPFSNAPIDTIKTRAYLLPFLRHLSRTDRVAPRSLSTSLSTSLAHLPHSLSSTGLQKAEALPGQTAFQRIAAIATDMWRQEGVRSFYKGITPRVLRVAPGQAVVFAVYERVRRIMETLNGSSEDNTYSE